MNRITIDELNDSRYDKSCSLSKLRAATSNSETPEHIFKACKEYESATNAFKEMSEQFVNQELEDFHKENVAEVSE